MRSRLIFEIAKFLRLIIETGDERNTPPADFRPKRFGQASALVRCVRGNSVFIHVIHRLAGRNTEVIIWPQAKITVAKGNALGKKTQPPSLAEGHIHPFP
jgi:hypothetical protein